MQRDRARANPALEVALVITHEDNPNEKIWFASVAQVARDAGIPVITPTDPHAPEVLEAIRAAKPDFFFSFYYRLMLSPELLAMAPRGAFNMHGSLLPKYRGRVPVNWAVLHGETEAGATLHGMVAKPDKGAIVDQMAVPILGDDTAQDVFEKVTLAAELVLHRALPGLLDGTAVLSEQDQAQASYFGGRKAEDGRIQWKQSAQQIHNLVRAVAPPYPGAFATLPGSGTLRLLRTRVLHANEAGPPALLVRTPVRNAANDRHNVAPNMSATLELLVRCGDGGLLLVLEADLDGVPFNAESCAQLMQEQDIKNNEFPLSVNP
jgi:methionyl-tRNA formyltransferase